MQNKFGEGCLELEDYCFREVSFYRPGPCASATGNVT